ncbi:gamma-glutamyltransferase family protein [Rhodovarius crocodyli]|nr:gamma-glutamyltransferase [Rhodovarius crocodyli]
MRWLIVLALSAALPAHAEPARRMVATAHPLASQAGLDMLRRGGTAMDAAVAAQAVLSVVEPHASGLGGGALILSWQAARRELLHVEGLSAAPADVPRRLTEGTTLAVLERSGRAVGVPGAVAALAAAHARHGALPWAVLFEPAIRAAEQGFPTPPYLQAVLRTRARALSAVPEIEALYFENGQPRAFLRNPEQAAALRLVAAHGPAAIQGGALGQAMVRAVGQGALPGHMSMADLTGFEPRERPALCAERFGRRVCTAAPPSSGGVAVLQQLAFLEQAGIARLAPDSAAAAHLLLEASRLTRADRRAWVGDPAQVEVPTEGLLDAAYLRGRAGLIDPARAQPEVAPGSPPRRHAAVPPAADPMAESATSHVAIVDGAGNAVSFTTTNNLNFGAEILAGGITLNNGLTNFAAATDAMNGVAPRRRPATTMAPTIVFDGDGVPMLVLGAGGGARIIDAVTVALVETLAWGADARRATARPRIGAQTGTEELEAATPAAALAPELAAMGHNPRAAAMNTGLQVLRRIPGGWEGAADPRRDGAALGE